MCLCVYLNGGDSRDREGIQMVRKPMKDNQLPEDSTEEGSLHSSDNYVLDDGGGNYGYCPTCFFSEKKVEIMQLKQAKIQIYRRYT